MDGDAMSVKCDTKGSTHFRARLERAMQKGSVTEAVVSALFDDV